MDDDKAGWIAFLIAAIVVAFCVLSLCGCDREIEVDKKVPGMPLDGYEVDEYYRPAWLPNCQHAYKVYDRQTGDAWWLLEIQGRVGIEKYVVLPLDEADR